VIVWAAIYYPHDAAVVEAPFHSQQAQLQVQLDSLRPADPRRAETQQQLDRLDREIEGAYQRQSLLARAGRMIEPVVRPLGWDWRIGCAVIASFPAREIVVATMGVIFEGGDDLDSKSEQASIRLQAKLRAATREDTGQPLLNTAVALSILVFFALSAQCAATLAVIRRETNSWRWPAFTFAYMTALAYIGAFLTYHAATWIAG
jgi:ferrous iron transport protein B